MKIPIDIKTGSVSQLTSDNGEVVVGIDLGTTNSLIAIADQEGKPVILGGHKNRNIVPSVIHFFEDGSYIVGNEAKSYLGSQPKATLYSVKRLMGKSYTDLSAETGRLGYTLMPSSEDEGLVKVEVNGVFYSPVELSSYLLKALIKQAEEDLGKTIGKAVITVPAYFNDAQRQATRDAGKLAGLDVLRIVNEPTAASLAYGIGLDKNEKGIVAVYDLGGGTFDISILNIEDGIFEVLATKGDTYLGGDDFDLAIVDYWKIQYQSTFSEIHLQNLHELRWLAEEAKKTLTDKDEFIVDWKGIKLNIDKGQANLLFSSLIERTIQLCHEAVQDAGLTTSAINTVVMVGGSTRVPAVKHAVGQFFNCPIHDEVNPDEVVALGAAIQADILAGNRKDLLLLDVTPLSLGIETLGGLMDVIVPRNTKVPARFGRNYTTSVDGQKNLAITVYQGERDLVKYNRKLGSFILKNLPPMPAGLPKLEVLFILDADGILTVRARELRSDVATEVTIKSAYGISDEEMARLLLDSIKEAQTDMQEKQQIEAKNEVISTIQAVKKFIDLNKPILTAEEVGTLEHYNTLLESSLQSGDKDDMLSIVKQVNDYSMPLAHRAMDNAVVNALTGKKID
ncbi:MAG: Fe-S protein assembly chaperone HscA [Saprospiraceae bacterium]